MTTILFTGGGTLGPVTPLLAVAESLRKRHPQWRFVWVGTEHGPERTLIAPQMEFVSMPAVKLRRYLRWESVTEFFRVPTTLRAAHQIVDEYRPNVVIGAGGYVQVPLMWSAHRRGAKILIHQQDVRPGLANRLSARWADQITVTFEEGLSAFGRPAILTGNPVRAGIFSADPSSAREQLQLPPEKPVVLILGGGTGSMALNRLVTDLVDPLLPQASIIHLTGIQRDYQPLVRSGYVVRPFMGPEVMDALALADVVVTRAGMGSLTELAALKKAAIIIPIPDSHQEDNAAMLAAQNAAIVLPQSTLTPNILLTMIRDLLDHPHKREVLGQSMHAWNKSGAANAIANEIERLVS